MALNEERHDAVKQEDNLDQSGNAFNFLLAENPPKVNLLFTSRPFEQQCRDGLEESENFMEIKWEKEDEADDNHCSSGTGAVDNYFEHCGESLKKQNTFADVRDLNNVDSPPNNVDKRVEVKVEPAAEDSHPNAKAELHRGRDRERGSQQQQQRRRRRRRPTAELLPHADSKTSHNNANVKKSPRHPRSRRRRTTRFICRVCNREFRGNTDRTRHENETHTSAELSPYICTFCGKTFKSKQCHKLHEKRHEAGYYDRNWKDRCKWEGCNEVFFHLGHFKRHMLKHTGLYPFTCSICGLGLLSEQATRTHEKGVHEEAGMKEACQRCGRLVKPRYMKWHMARHEGKTQSTCDTCGKVFLTNANRLRHQRIHVKVKPHTCKHCGKAFVQKSNMISHEHTHTGTCPYKCASCGKGFIQLTNMKKHQSNCSEGNKMQY